MDRSPPLSAHVLSGAARVELALPTPPRPPRLFVIATVLTFGSISLGMPLLPFLIASRSRVVLSLGGRPSAVLMIVVLLASLMALMWVAACLGVMMTLLPERATLTLTADEIVLHRRRGPLRTTRRWPTAKPRAVLVTTPPSVHPLDARRPLPARRASVAMAFPDDRVVLARQLPHAAAIDLARPIAAHLQRLGNAVRVIDTFDTHWLNSDALVPPPDEPWTLDQLPGGVTRVEPRRPRSTRRLLATPSARGALWRTVLPLTFYALLPVLAPELSGPARAAVFAPLAISLFGACRLAHMLHAGPPVTSFEAGPDGLTLLRARRRRHWRTAALRRLTVASKIDSNGRPRYVLRLATDDGNRRHVATGDPIALQYLGALMRRALGVPAAVPTETTADEGPLPPIGPPFASSVTPDGQLLVHRPPTGLRPRQRVVAGLLSLALLALLLLALFAAWFPSATDRGAAWAESALFGTLAGIGLASVAADARETCDVRAGPASLALTRRRLGRPRHHAWPRNAIASVYADIRTARGPFAQARLVVALRDGTTVRMTQGDLAAMQHLAAHLRRAMGIDTPPENLRRNPEDEPMSL